jgi:hypothetical protein
MPDPLRKTISATQAPALFNVSPYQTRWMLWNRFAHGIPDDTPEDSHMRWGKLMQPLILPDVAREWKLEVHDNAEKYYRRNLLGATRDATIIAPDKGPGAVEVKCVFERHVWADKWAGGRMVPREHEIQLQTQMLVGDGDGGPSYKWGLIVAWVCAELYFFERGPIVDLWHKLDIEAGRFFRSIEDKQEPDPFGSPIEIPWMRDMFPMRERSSLDLSTDYAHVKTAEDLRQYAFHKAEASGNKRAEEELRAKLLGVAKDNNEVVLPCGYRYFRQRSGKGFTIVPVIPDVPLQPPPVPETLIHAG